MPASTKTPVDATGSILLVEEYAALALAIGAALKSFAPAQQTRVVGTLAAAEAAALEHQPELLVIDFDPPQKGAIGFFNRLKSALPDTRVVILTAGIPEAVRAARHGPSAFRFVEKPFDLAAFGKAVQAALQRPSRQEQHTLRHLNLTDLLPLLCAAGASVAVDVTTTGGRTGAVQLAHGQIVDAAAAGWRGADAVAEMLRWEMPRLDEREQPLQGARSIRQPWAAVLAECFERSRAVPAVSATVPRAAASSAATRKLVVIDDTDLLLIFVEEVLMSAGLDVEIITADSGSEGLRQVRATAPDAVLLDFSLPDITGDEVCRQLREHAETADIPIIMMSGHVAEMATTAERYPNVVATIAKPFLSAAMVDIVRETLATPRAETRGSSERAVAPAAESPAEQAAPNDAAEAERPSDANGKHDSGPAPADDPGDESAATDLPPSPTSLSSAAEALPAGAGSPVAVRESTVATLTAQSRPTFHVVPRESPPLDYAAVPRSSTPTDGAIHQNSLEFEEATPPAMPRVRIPSATHNAVVLGLSLEVLAIRFSSALQMGAIRARPWSWTVSLHVHPNAMPGVSLPEAGFELGKVELNARGHIDAVRLVPATGLLTRPPRRDVFPVADVTVLPGVDEKAMELLPGGAAPMTMQLFASFELVGVELSPTFGIGALVLKSRGGEIRVTLQPASRNAGVVFKSAQVLLDRSARIAEVLLDEVGAPADAA